MQVWDILTRESVAVQLVRKLWFCVKLLTQHQEGAAASELEVEAQRDVAETPRCCCLAVRPGPQEARSLGCDDQ